jgi:TIM-barrel protein
VGSDQPVAFRPRVALASLSGVADAGWARRHAGEAGLALLGGLSVDRRTRAAARRLLARGREEFLPADPVAFVDRQFRALADAPVRPGINVRAADAGALEPIARVCREHEAVLEVNAHCRQPEMCSVGAGQSLLAAPDRLAEQVRVAAATGATVSVKCRTEVAGVDLPAVAATVDRAGADLVHVDAMDSEAVVADVAGATEASVVANNGVRDRATVREYLAHGADAVSVARAADDPATMRRVRRATAAWFAPASEPQP